MRAAAAIPAVGLLAGSAFGLLVSDVPRVVPTALMLVCAAAALWAWRTQRSRALVAAVGVAFFAGGALLAEDAWRRAWRPTLRVAFEELARADRAQAAAEHRVMPDDDEAFATIEGVLRTDAAVTASGVSLSLEVESLRGGDVDPIRAGYVPVRATRLVSGGVEATVTGSLAADRVDAWRAGRRVRVPMQLRRPSRFLDPGVPDHERALARRGTTLAASVKSGALVEVIARGSTLAEAFGSVRAFSRRAIGAAVGRWSPRSAGIVAAIVIGDRAGLDPDVQRALQEAGTYHVIAISGGNIAILAGLMLGVFRFAGLLGRTAMCAAIAALVAYGYLVGGGASVDRATLMAVIYFAGRTIDQRGAPHNTLAFAAACLIADEPLSVADPAFVLTFGATLAILLVVPIVVERQLPRGVAPVAAMFAASCAAEAMLFPVGALVFSRVTFAGLALNFLAIPLMAVAQIAGMAVVPLELFSERLAMAAGCIAHLGAAGLVRSADLVRAAPFLTYRVAAPNWLSVFVYYAGLTTAWTLWRRQRLIVGSAETQTARRVRRSAAVAAVCAAAWMLAEPWTLLAARGDGRLHMTFIDVGQGDAIFVRFPRGATLLVDAGGLAIASTFDIGDRVVAPVLRWAGVRRLDVVALTHGDPDHIGGAGSIIREFRPREVWEGIPVPRFEPLRALHAEAQQLGVGWSSVKAGDHKVVDEVEVVVRHPPVADWERQKVRNDDSIVIELRWRDVSVLLTGDIGKAVEKGLIAAIPRRPIRVVKVPHHGSLTSSTPDFVRASAPRVAIVSAGRNNHFGHPAPDVLARYREAGAEIFRTDRDGAVTVDSDGYSLNIHTFAGRTLSTR